MNRSDNIRTIGGRTVTSPVRNRSLHPRGLVLIARTWFAATRRGRPRDADGDLVPSAARWSIDIAHGNAVCRSRARNQRDIWQTRSSAAVAATRAPRCSRTIVARHSGSRPSPPSIDSTITVLPWNPMRHTPCGPPAHNWRRRVTTLSIPHPVPSVMITCYNREYLFV